MNPKIKCSKTKHPTYDYEPDSFGVWIYHYKSSKGEADMIYMKQAMYAMKPYEACMFANDDCYIEQFETKKLGEKRIEELLG